MSSPPQTPSPTFPGLLLLPNSKVRYSRQTCLVPSASQLQTDEEECKGHHKGVVANIAGSRGQHEVAFTDAETASEVGCDVTDIPLGCRRCDVTSELPSPTLPLAILLALMAIVTIPIMVVMMIMTMKAIIRPNKRFPSDELYTPRTASVETATGRPITHTYQPLQPLCFKIYGVLRCVIDSLAKKFSVNLKICARVVNHEYTALEV